VALLQLAKTAPALTPVAAEYVSDWLSFRRAVSGASLLPQSAGALLKKAGSSYRADGASKDWARFDRQLLIRARVIGLRRAPLPPPDPKKRYTAAEMAVLLPGLLHGSDTYNYFCAALDGGAEVPLGSGSVVSPADLQYRWDEAAQGTIDGLRHDTTAIDLLQAINEGFYLRLATIAEMIAECAKEMP